VVSTVPLLFIQAFVIPSSSMENTLLLGDRILVRRFPSPSVARGDLVVVRSPIKRDDSLVKRVIGIPGDRIKLVNKTVYRNGTALVEPYAIHKSSYMDPYRDNFPAGPAANAPAAQDMLEHHLVDGEVVVPERSYFLLGDNRDDSFDSRYFGFVERGAVLGKPFLIYDSERPPSDTGATPTRWARIFKLL
jgi:signal peptidase I